MRLAVAVDLLAPSGVDALGPTVWADLGCGTGTFTLALAEVLADGSRIHAVDRDASALRSIPSEHGTVSIVTHRADFTKQPWPFDEGVDGILMANSLHYIDDQTAFLRACNQRMNSRRRFLIVEYDTAERSRWVPHPVSRAHLRALVAPLGYTSIEIVGTRPSIYRRAPLYAALVKPA